MMNFCGNCGGELEMMPPLPYQGTGRVYYGCPNCGQVVAEKVGSVMGISSGTDSVNMTYDEYMAKVEEELSEDQSE